MIKLKDILKEATGTSGVGSFVGRSGNVVDKLFAGAFHPEFGQIKKLLDKQVEDNIMNRMYTDDVTPQIDPDFYEVDYEYEYDEYVEKDNSKFKTTGDKMQMVDLEIQYDKIKDNTEKNKKFINTSQTEMQMVDLEIQYDKIKDKTKENEKFINNSNGWKSIYDSKKY